jgi:hypothetical protein
VIRAAAASSCCCACSGAARVARASASIMGGSRSAAGAPRTPCVPASAATCRAVSAAGCKAARREQPDREHSTDIFVHS